MNWQTDIINYHEEIRNVLFVSGVTIGSFIFSMKSFILKIMKEEYYDTEEYRKHIASLQKTDRTVKYYASLRNFSNLLIGSVVASLVSAILQITIGYVGYICLTLVCFLAAITSWALVGFSIYQMGKNWNALIQYSEERIGNDQP